MDWYNWMQVWALLLPSVYGLLISNRN